MNDNEQQWLDRAGAELNRSIDDIDAQTRSKLTRVRHQALKAKPVRQTNMYRFSAAGLVTAALVIAIVFNRPQQRTEQEEMIDDLDLITTSESLELFEDLEFYEWLEVYDIPS